MDSGGRSSHAPIDAALSAAAGCDPTDDILVAPLEPGIADVGLVFLERAPANIKPAVLAAPGTLIDPRALGQRLSDTARSRPRTRVRGRRVAMGRQAAYQGLDRPKDR